MNSEVIKLGLLQPTSAISADNKFVDICFCQKIHILKLRVSHIQSF